MKAKKIERIKELERQNIQYDVFRMIMGFEGWGVGLKLDVIDEIKKEFKIKSD